MIQIDMKMPKRCCDCRLCDMCGYCKALLKYVLTEDNYNVRAEDCPLKEVTNEKWISVENPEQNLPMGHWWVTREYSKGYREVDEVYFDMTEWSDPIDNVVAYKEYSEPEVYRE